MSLEAFENARRTEDVLPPDTLNYWIAISMISSAKHGDKDGKLGSTCWPASCILQGTRKVKGPDRSARRSWLYGIT